MLFFSPLLFVTQVNFGMQVQKRFEALKKRKDPSTFSEQGEEKNVTSLPQAVSAEHAIFFTGNRRTPYHTYVRG